MAVHKECTNFSSGWCALKEISVDPDGPACESFTPHHSNSDGSYLALGLASMLVGGVMVCCSALKGK